MKRISITAILLALLLSGAPAWAQTEAPTQAQSDLRQARDQRARDREALEAARKSGDPAKVKTAEAKLRSSERTYKQKRRVADQDRERARTHREDAKRDGTRWKEEEKPASSDTGREGKGKSGWAHAEKKGYGKSKN